jgi:plastocyanin
MVLAIALALVLGQDSARPATCRLSGKLTLVEHDRPVSPEGLAYVFVKTVSASKWRPPNTTHTIVQKNKQFSKSVLVVVKGDTVEFTNEDAITHDAFSIKDITFKLLPSTNPKTGAYALTDPGTAHVQCNIHKSMRLDILSVANPFYAGVAADGSYAIADVPRGEYTLIAWEPHGNTADQRHVRCEDADSRVPDMKLKRNPEPELVHRDGSPYDKDDPYIVK